MKVIYRHQRYISNTLHGVILMLSSTIAFSQTLDWESITDCSPMEYDHFNAICKLGNNLISAGSCGNSDALTLHKFNSIGDTIFFKTYDSLFSGVSAEDVQIDSSFNIYVTGAKNLKGYVAKFDSNGNHLWNLDLNIQNGLGAPHILKIQNDQSILVSGERLYDPNLYLMNIFVYHINPNGVVFTDKDFLKLNNETCRSIVEMKDGSFNFIGTMRIGFNNYPYILKTDFQFNEVKRDSIFGSSIDNVFRAWGWQHSDGNLIIAGQESSPAPVPKGFIFKVDSNFILTSDTMISNTYVRGVSLKDSSILIYGITTSLPSFIGKIDNNFSPKWNYSLGAQNKVVFEGLINQDSCFYGAGNVFYSGGQGSDFYRLKLADVGEPFIPDFCKLSPPTASFSWTYDFPILSLKDNSFSGLQYHDSIYNYQWSSGFGDTSSQDNLQIVFDTTNGASVPIQLVITNWHGCKDTVIQIFNSGTILDLSTDELFSGIRIFPNPVQEELIFESTHSGFFEIELQDIKGRSFFKETIEGWTGKFNMQNLPPGVYIARIEVNGVVVRRKVVKN